MKCAIAVLTILGLANPAGAVTLRGAANASTIDTCSPPPCNPAPQTTVEDQCSQYATMATFTGAASDHCQSKHCMPQCRYQCTDPTCEQECTPECLAPECQTRCPDLKGTSMYAAGCKITCAKPACEVVCPDRHCGENGCAECKTVCQRPSCKVACPDAGCQEVCKPAKCKFNCVAAKEKCAKPDCKLTCEQSQCMNVEDGLPPLTQGMVIVDAVTPESLNDKGNKKGYKPPSSAAAAPAPAAAAPAGFIQNGVRSMSMAVKRVVAVHGTEEAQFEHSMVTLPMH